MAVGALPNRSVDGGGAGRGGGNGHDPRGGGGGPAVPSRAYVTGMTVALAAVLMFFMALVSAYIVRRDMPNSGWIPLVAFPHILWLDTLILVASSVTLARARRFFLEGRENAFRLWWKITAMLGLAFLIGQCGACWQLAEQGVYLSTNPSSSFFFVFTVCHGLHILGGIAALLLVILRPARRLGTRTATGVAAMYWHFMDGLWLFLFLLLVAGKA